MTTYVHQAFPLMPDVEPRGLMCQRTLCPLLARACTIHLDGAHHITRCVVTHDFVNHTPNVVDAFVAFRLHPSWHVTTLRAHTVGGRTRYIQALAGSERSPDAVEPLSHEAPTEDMVTCRLPFGILAGQGVTTTLEFFFAHDTVMRDQVSWVLPAYTTVWEGGVAAAAESAAAVGSDFTTTEWRARFSFPTDSAANTPPRLAVNGHLAMPWTDSALLAGGAPTCNLPGAVLKPIGTNGRFDMSYASPANVPTVEGTTTTFTTDGLRITATRAPGAAAPEPFTLHAAKDSNAHTPSEDRVALALVLTPNATRAQLEAPNVEVTFLLDASASFRSRRHAWALQAAGAIAAALRAVPASVRANVVLYAESATTLWPEARALSAPGAVAEAEAFLVGESSPLAGWSPNETDMNVYPLGRARRLHDAIDLIYAASSCDASIRRHVVIMTDGGVELTPGTLAASHGARHARADLLHRVTAQGPNVRFTTVALGATSDAALLEELSAVSGGVPARVTQQALDAAALDGTNAVQTTLASLLAAAIVPALCGITVAFVAKDGTPVPTTQLRLVSALPALCDVGRRLTLYAFASCAAPPCDVHVTGRIGADVVKLSAHFVGAASCPETAAGMHRTRNAEVVSSPTATVVSFQDAFQPLPHTSTPLSDGLHMAAALHAIDAAALAVASPATPVASPATLTNLSHNDGHHSNTALEVARVARGFHLSSPFTCLEITSESFVAPDGLPAAVVVSRVAPSVRALRLPLPCGEGCGNVLPPAAAAARKLMGDFSQVAKGTSPSSVLNASPVMPSLPVAH